MAAPPVNTYAVPLADLVIQERSDVLVYPQQTPSDLVHLASEQAEVVTLFEKKLAEYDEKSRQQTKLLQNRLRELGEKQFDLVTDVGKKRKNYSDIPWYDTVQGQKLALKIDQELGKDIDLFQADKISKDQTEVATFLQKWVQHYQDLTSLNFIQIRNLPLPDKPAVPIDPSNRILINAELNRIKDSLDAWIPEYQKLRPMSNQINLLKESLSGWNLGDIVQNLDAIRDFDTIDPATGSATRVEVQKLLLPANYEDLFKFISPTNLASKLTDISSTALTQLQTSLSSLDVSPDLVKDPQFMENSAILQLHTYLSVELMQARKNQKEQIDIVRSEYLKFIADIQQLRLDVRERVGRQYNKLRQVSTQAGPEIAALRSELAQVQLLLRTRLDYEPIAKNSLKQVFYQYISASTAIKRELDELIDEYVKSSISAQLKWPQDIDGETFALGIYARVINPDPGSNTFPVQPLRQVPADATMTVSTLQGQTRVQLPNGNIQEVPVSTLTADVDVGSCTSDFDPKPGGVSYRQYQKFLAAYLFGPDEQTTPPPTSGPNYFPISPYRGLLAKWGAGTGKTNGAFKCMIDYFANYDKRYELAQFSEIPPYDFSNWIVLWVPNQKVLDDTWAKEIMRTFGRYDLVTFDANSFETYTNLDPTVDYSSPPKVPNSIFRPLPFLNTNSAWGWSGSDFGIAQGWVFRTDSGNKKLNKYIIAINMSDTTVSGYFMAQFFTNIILSNLTIDNSPGATNTKADILRRLDDLFKNPPKRAPYVTSLKQFSPFQIIDEFHNLALPMLKLKAPAKKAKFEVWEQHFPNWCWSKFLALTATPFDTNDQKLKFLTDTIQLLKYYPYEWPNGKTAGDYWPSGLYLDSLFSPIDPSDPAKPRVLKETNDLARFFSGWLANVSLNFDPTIFPYYETLVCKPSDKTASCIASSIDITNAASSGLDLKTLFKAVPFDKVPGKSKLQAEIRDLRDWRYVVPNLVYVDLEQASINAVNAKWAQWTNFSNQAESLAGKFLDLNLFDPEAPFTPAEQKCRNLTLPSSTVSPYDLTEDNSGLIGFFRGISDPNPIPSSEPNLSPLTLTPEKIERLSIENIIGSAGYAIKLGTDGIKTVQQIFVPDQPLAVGGIVGASEKASVCSSLLSGLEGKFIFIQTSANNSSLSYFNFWEVFWDKFDTAKFPVFQELPLVAGVAQTTSDSPNIQCQPDPWYRRGFEAAGANGDQFKIDLVKNSKVLTVDDAIARFYATATPKNRVLFFDAKSKTNGKEIAVGDRMKHSNSAIDQRELWKVAGVYWQALFNHPLNYKGDYFKAVFLGPPSAEGVSYFDVTYHVNLNTPQSMTVKTQSEARGARQCSFASLAWHSTTVTAEIDSGSNIIKYKVTDGTGIMPKLVLITLIATIPPNLAASSKMKITPDLKMANYLFKDPNIEGDNFLRYLESLAVDYLLFGDYSGLKGRGPQGAKGQTMDQWNLAKELVLQAVDTVTTNPTLTTTYVDYISRFYQGPDGKPPVITDAETDSQDVRLVYKRFLNGIAEQIIEASTQQPQQLYDLFAKLVYFAYNSIQVTLSEEELDSATLILRVGAWYQSLPSFNPLNWFGSGAPPPPQFKPIGQSLWLKNKYYMELDKLKQDAKSSVTPEQMTTIENQADWVIDLSEHKINFQELRVKENYLANYPGKFLPEVGYYEKLQTKLPGLPSQQDWTSDVVKINVEQGANSYKTTFPI